MNFPVLEEWKVTKEEFQVLKSRNKHTPVEFFNLLWDQKIWSEFEKQDTITIRRKKSKDKPIVLIKKFFAAILMKSVIGLISIEDFWGSNFFSVSFENQDSFISKEGYYDVTSTLVVDYERIHTLLVGNFKSHALPGFHVCIDEIRIPARHYECEIKKV